MVQPALLSFSVLHDFFLACLQIICTLVQVRLNAPATTVAVREFDLDTFHLQPCLNPLANCVGLLLKLPMQQSDRILYTDDTHISTTLHIVTTTLEKILLGERDKCFVLDIASIPFFRTWR